MRKNFPYVGAVYAFFVKDNKILLLQRANTGYMDGLRSVPAGHMDGKELARDAMIREIEEEIGLKISHSQLQKPITLFRITSGNNNSERFELFFPITTREGKIINNEPHKCSSIKRYDSNNLPEDTIPYIATMIKAHQNNNTFVEINEQTGECYVL